LESLTGRRKRETHVYTQKKNVCASDPLVAVRDANKVVAIRTTNSKCSNYKIKELEMQGT
jgi:hypothetical protein